MEEMKKMGEISQFELDVLKKEWQNKVIDFINKIDDNPKIRGKLQAIVPIKKFVRSL